MTLQTLDEKYDFNLTRLARKARLSTLTVRRFFCDEPVTVKTASAINFLDYCADLDKCPTIEQVETALGSVAVNSREDAKRVKDAHTWADILRR